MKGKAHTKGKGVGYATSREGSSMGYKGGTARAPTVNMNYNKQPHMRGKGAKSERP